MAKKLKKIEKKQKNKPGFEPTTCIMLVQCLNHFPITVYKGLSCQSPLKVINTSWLYKITLLSGWKPYHSKTRQLTLLLLLSSRYSLSLAFQSTYTQTKEQILRACFCRKHARHLGYTKHEPQLTILKVMV